MKFTKAEAITLVDDRTVPMHAGHPPFANTRHHRGISRSARANPPQETDVPHMLTVLKAPALRRYSPIDKYALGRGLPGERPSENTRQVVERGQKVGKAKHSES